MTTPNKFMNDNKVRQKESTIKKRKELEKRVKQGQEVKLEITQGKSRLSK